MSKYKLIKLYKDTEKTSISRHGGNPIGMTKETWPRYSKSLMYPLITLHRDMLVQNLPENIEALTLFKTWYTNKGWEAKDAYKPGNKLMKIVVLSKEDLARGETSAEMVFGKPLSDEIMVNEYFINKQEVEYDFDSVKNLDEGDKESDLSAEEVDTALDPYLREQINSTVDGKEVFGLSSNHGLWWQYYEMPEGHHLLFQYYEDDVDGEMYVTANEDYTEFFAWWQR